MVSLVATKPISEHRRTLIVAASGPGSLSLSLSLSLFLFFSLSLYAYLDMRCEVLIWGRFGLLRGYYLGQVGVIIWTKEIFGLFYSGFKRLVHIQLSFCFLPSYLPPLSLYISLPLSLSISLLFSFGCFSSFLLLLFFCFSSFF